MDVKNTVVMSSAFSEGQPSTRLKLRGCDRDEVPPRPSSRSKTQGNRNNFDKL